MPSKGIVTATLRSLAWRSNQQRYAAADSIPLAHLTCTKQSYENIKLLL